MRLAALSLAAIGLFTAMSAAEASMAAMRAKAALSAAHTSQKLPKRHHAQAKVAPAAEAVAGASSPRFASKRAAVKTKSASLGPCKDCIYVVERLKHGYQYMLPAVCVEIFSKTKSQEEYTKCHEVVASLSVWGSDAKAWMKTGCYKSEPYGASELVKPCPSHVMCSKMQDLSMTGFCAAPGTDFVDAPGAEEEKDDATASDEAPVSEVAAGMPVDQELSPANPQEGISLGYSDGKFTAQGAGTIGDVSGSFSHGPDGTKASAQGTFGDTTIDATYDKGSSSVGFSNPLGGISWDQGSGISANLNLPGIFS